LITEDDARRQEAVVNAGVVYHRLELSAESLVDVFIYDG